MQPRPKVQGPATLSRIPGVVLVLVALNLVGAIVLVLRPEMALEQGFYPHAPSLSAALVAMFLHFNLFHLLGNMLFLASVGPAVERGTTWWKFAVLYLAGGLIGAYSHALMAGGDGLSKPLLGASGAISACVGYAGVRFFGSKVEFVPGHRLTVGFLVGLWALLQAIGVWVRLGEPPEMGGTAFFAHLGGFLTGVCLSLLFRANREASADGSRALLGDLQDRSPAAVLAAARAHLEQHPHDPEAILQVGRSFEQLGDHAAEADHWVARWAALPSGQRWDAISRLVLLGQIERIPAPMRLRVASELKLEHRDLSEALLTSIINEQGSNPDCPDALFQLAALREASQPEQARQLAERLLRDFPVHPATEMARARGLLG